MLLIPVVEQCVGGDMSQWPRVILEFLFSFPPATFSTSALAGFLCGNGLPCSMALHLVSVCHYAPTEEMLQQIRSLYVEWYSNPNARHLSPYWDMRHQKFVWLNGSNRPLLEFLYTPGGNNDTITGFGIKPRAYMLRRRLYHIRHTVHHCD